MNKHSERDHALLSASSAHRWLACPPSAVAAEAYQDQETEFTREGTLAHEVAEAIAFADDVSGYHSIERLDGSIFIAGLEEKAADITEEMVACAEAYSDYIQELKTFDDAIVLLEQRVDFSPWVPEGFGTCDCILIQKDPVFPDTNTLTIIDYKYGKGVAVSAEDNPQMKLYALGALNDYGIALDVRRVEMHIFQPRLNNVSTCSLVVEDLLEWGEDRTCGGGFWRVDDGRGLVILYGRSFNFGAPVIGRVRCVEWVGVPPIELPVFYLAEWPHDGIMIPVIY